MYFSIACYEKSVITLELHKPGVITLNLSGLMKIWIKKNNQSNERRKPLKRQAAKAGLQISFEKTDVITNIRPPSRELDKELTNIDLAKKFKYLGERMEPVSYTHLDVYKRQLQVNIRIAHR